MVLRCTNSRTMAYAEFTTPKPADASVSLLRRCIRRPAACSPHERHGGANFQQSCAAAALGGHYREAPYTTSSFAGLSRFRRSELLRLQRRWLRANVKKDRISDRFMKRQALPAPHT